MKKTKRIELKTGTAMKWCNEAMAEIKKPTSQYAKKHASRFLHLMSYFNQTLAERFDDYESLEKSRLLAKAKKAK